MEYIDGVPLLDIARMDTTIKQELVSGLVSEPWPAEYSVAKLVE